MSSSRRARSRRIRRIVGNIFVVLLAVMAALLLIGLFLPGRYRIERSIEIRAKPEAIYPALASLRQWPEWTAWNLERDPAVRFTFDSPETGAGAVYRWEGPELGQGQLRLTRAEPDKGVWYDLDFEGGRYLSNGSLTLQTSGEAVKVVWLHEGSLGKNPVNRYFGLMMDSMMGPDFEKGLAGLKARVETPAAPSR